MLRIRKLGANDSNSVKISELFALAKKYKESNDAMGVKYLKNKMDETNTVDKQIKEFNQKHGIEEKEGFVNLTWDNIAIRVKVHDAEETYGPSYEPACDLIAAMEGANEKTKKQVKNAKTKEKWFFRLARLDIALTTGIAVGTCLLNAFGIINEAVSNFLIYDVMLPLVAIAVPPSLMFLVNYSKHEKLKEIDTALADAKQTVQILEDLYAKYGNMLYDNAAEKSRSYTLYMHGAGQTLIDGANQILRDASNSGSSASKND